jgi:pimeloyl-ACP methyl ester carboxylesterase
MDFNIFDTPPIRSILFYPRKGVALTSPTRNMADGTIPVDEGVELGYRLVTNEDKSSPLLLYFHGNGEIASDYTMVSREFLDLGLSLLVVDYRGYGWSTGEPRVKHLIGDAEPIMKALPKIREQHGTIGERTLVMGRSLGSIQAIEIAHAYGYQLDGLIVESGFAQLPPLFARLGLPVQWQANLPDPIGNLRKMTEITLPLLIIHGERDSLIPVANGQKLFDASPSDNKHISRIPGVGHNDLMVRRDDYFGAMRSFLSGLEG